MSKMKRNFLEDLGLEKEVVDKIKNIDQLNADYQEKYQQFYQRFCSWEDGNASKRVVEEVFK